MHIDDVLLEREGLLARAEAAVADACEGSGGVLLVEGPAGIGKTALLSAICASAPHLTQLRARGAELERGFPHGVARQLLEAHVRGLDAPERRSAFEGAARLAEPVLSDGAGAEHGAAADASFAVTHGLYWLVANLAERAPLLIAVDDAHWADLASLRFLSHLARRIDGLRVLLVVCVRTAEPDSPQELLAAIAAAADVLRPPPLSTQAVSRLIPGADEAFVRACHQATGGVPFLLRELLAALGDRPPTAGTVPLVHATGPHSVAEATLIRLRRVGPEAASLAHALAVLGSAGHLHRAARLAGLPVERAVQAADALVAMNVLRPQRPLDFIHPIVRSAVYDAVPPAARAQAHLRAAVLLEEDAAGIDAVAGHLMHAEPGSRAGIAADLRAAADRALVGGAPESAAAYLRRALDEALDDEQRAELLLALAGAERLISIPTAVAPLREAHRLARDPTRRARIAYEFADTTHYVGGWDEAAAWLDDALSSAELDEDMHVRIEAMRAAQDLYSADRAHRGFGRLPALIEIAGGSAPASRVMALMLAGNAGWVGQPAELIWELVERGFDGGRFLAEEGSDSWVTVYLVQAAVLTDDLDRAAALIDEVQADAQRRGSVRGVATCVYHRSWLWVRRGDLVAAEADIRTTVELMPQANGIGGHAEEALWALSLDAVLERPDLDDRAAWIAEREAVPELDQVVWGIHMREARGRARLARGDTTGGILDLRACQHPVFARGAQPNAWAWRATLAVALAPTHPEEALALAQSDLRKAERVGRPRGKAVALRTLGLVQNSIDHLAESVREAAASPSRLEHARSLVELGAALRRANRRADAREPLREGLDLAHRCGAVRLSERARAELAATGARPRRQVLTGADALTATERRIAGMAARGMSNPEIAQALFVTRKTVENHLARIYAKLGIHSRNQLSKAMHP